mgnify:CR=1 FL=1
MRRSSFTWAYCFTVSLTVFLVSPYCWGTNDHSEPADDSDATAPSTAVYVSYKLQSNHPHERICIGDHTQYDNNNMINNGSYTCTTRGKQIQREEQRADPYNWGVDQRIDGSDTEKELTRDVISMMQQYFMDEVLVKPVYKDVRQNWYV